MPDAPHDPVNQDAHRHDAESRHAHAHAQPPNRGAHGHGHEHGHSHGHGHSHTSGVTDQKRIGIAFVLIAAFMVVELIGGLLSGSLALLADAGHMVSDAAALAFSWIAIHYGKRPATLQLSYGYKRLEVLAAFVNGCALFVIAAWIVFEAIRRFYQPVPVVGMPMLVVAFAGLLANIAAFAVLHGGNRDNLNMRGAWLHVLGDMLGSVAAIVAACVILATGWTPIDPILSIFVAVIILKSAWGIVKSSAHILLEGAPAELSSEDIKRDLEANVPEVRNAHHIHAWSITGERHMVTLHVYPAAGVSTRQAVVAVQQRLATRFAVDHVTVQVEDEGCPDGPGPEGRC
ncbi:cation diffusion facilitator family transporter [Pandoraea sp. CB10b_02]|uniref:cation diffusion facilitator family transporter n=1 Tax=Pandoraea sp. CB10b_02 TaxID=2014535 RepID=UPI002580FF05|nr:cation diffusion facilitator family transporter [Pandoraea sp. CB10b_02]